MKDLYVETKTIEIFVAGDFQEAKRICRRYCFNQGLCVTVSPTDYVYTGGEESGVIVGLRSYPRFPDTEIAIHARNLAYELIEGLDQWSAMVVHPADTVWITRRD